MIKVWGRHSSTNVIKVLWLCDEIGLPFTRVDVGGAFGGLDSPAFLDMNPNRMIPVIQDGETVVWESHAVLRYLAAKYGPDGIYPAALAARSEVERWLDWHLGTLGPVLNPVFITLYRTPPVDRDQKVLARAIAALANTLARLDRHMAGRDTIATDQFTIADIAFGNSLWRWFEFPFDKPELPNLQRWQAAMATRPGYQHHVQQPLA